MSIPGPGGRTWAVLVVGLVTLAGTASPVLAHSGTLTVPSTTPHSHTTSEAAGVCSFPVTREDATGTNVTLSEPPDRVVPLDGATAQTLREVGAWETVVAVPPEASYLNGTDGLPRVATNDTVSVENVAALRPDLVIAPRRTPNATIGRLRDRGERVYVLDQRRTQSEIANSTRRIGRLVDACDGAARTIGWVERNVDSIQSKQALVARARAMYVDPSGGTAGNDTFVDTVLRRSLLVNAPGRAGLTGTGTPQPAVVRKLDPEWYVVHAGATNVTREPRYRKTTAARANQTVAVDPVYLTQPGPRSLVRAVFAISTTVYSGSISTDAYVPRSEIRRTPTPPERSAEGPFAGLEEYADQQSTDSDSSVVSYFILLLLSGFAAYVVLVFRWRERQ